ncbi:phosphatase PAP2 family protein [bacterium]|nr:phosphatase PAP2 family protein [bacterium]
MNRRLLVGLLFYAIAFSLGFVSSSRGDEVTFWNGQLLDSVRALSTPPPKASRAMAMVHTAIYDAVNSVDRTHRPYAGYVLSNPLASKEAATAQAAHDTLVSLYPTRTSIFDAALTSRLNAIADGSSKTDGIATGSASASQIITLRSNDNSSLVVPYSPGGSPGDWQPTPPAFAPALLPNWPLVTPWAMPLGTSFVNFGTPPAVGSAEYTAALNEVRDLGSATSATRTADQTDIAKFWADGSGTATPPGHWNRIAEQIVAAEGFTIDDSARLFAQLNIALADAAITSWTYKYQYDYWRPVTAIQSTLDPSWTPLLTTPPFPSFTSGHSTFSGAASQILSDWFGNSYSFTTGSEGFALANRSFNSFSEAADEAGLSRIYGGIHFNFDNVVGLSSGRALGSYVYQTQLQAVPEVGSIGLVMMATTLFAFGWVKMRRLASL